MVATPLRWAFFALPAPAQKAVRIARERVRAPKAETEKISRENTEEEIFRYAEVIFRLGQR